MPEQEARGVYQQKGKVRARGSLGRRLCCSQAPSDELQSTSCREQKQCRQFSHLKRPHLGEWSAFEGDYLASLSEVTRALLDASIQLPISGNCRADVREVGEALESSFKIMDAVASHVESFLPEMQCIPCTFYNHPVLLPFSNIGNWLDVG
ncbi:hypothetical protein NL676_013217 [Syzygium grande]|nr:hypothetical protein NL676_013217 [Syzygium grande]